MIKDLHMAVIRSLTIGRATYQRTQKQGILHGWEAAPRCLSESDRVIGTIVRLEHHRVIRIHDHEECLKVVIYFHDLSLPHTTTTVSS